MLTTLRDFFHKHLADSGERDPAAEQQRTRLAAAALLVEVTRADYGVSETERDALQKALREQFELSQEAATELMSLAESRSDSAVDLHQFTSELNHHFSAEEKIVLIEQLWRLAYADQVLHKYEEALIKKIADLLHVSHMAVMAAKHRARNRQIN